MVNLKTDMKVLLIYPYFLEERIQVEEIGIPPIGLYYVAAVLKENHYDVEQASLFDAIRTGKTINNCDYMVNSTMTTIMATYAIWTGKRITWEEAWNTKTNFAQPEYNWDMKPPVMPNDAGKYDIPIPGITKVI